MTKYVIDKIQFELKRKQAYVDIYNIENIRAQSIHFNNYDTVGIAYPVHSFNAPKIVINFAIQLPIVKSMNTFIISTAGENNSINFASSKLLIDILSKKGFEVIYDRQFIMPSKFMIKYDGAKVQQFIAFVGRAEWFGAKWIGKSFYADRNCNRCGVCANNCPNHSIKIHQPFKYL